MKHSMLNCITGGKFNIIVTCIISYYTRLEEQQYNKRNDKYRIVNEYLQISTYIDRRVMSASNIKNKK